MTDRYAVIGNPIGHSKSPAIHAAFARTTGQELEYGAIEGPPGGFAGAADAFRAAGGRGMNVTAPFKLDAFRYARTLSGPARLAGAVNCLSFDGEAVRGDNFDGVGLLRDIEHNLGHPLRGRRVMLLGAGGAARGALLPFLHAGPSELVVVDRTRADVAGLAAAGAGHAALAIRPYEEVDGLGRFDLVVNATSASLKDEMPPLPAGAMRGARLAYDLLYGKGLTPFLRRARAEGVASLADGVGMLVEQAAEAFALWRGVRPDTRPVIQAMTLPLS